MSHWTRVSGIQKNLQKYRDVLSLCLRARQNFSWWYSVINCPGLMNSIPRRNFQSTSNQVTEDVCVKTGRETVGTLTPLVLLQMPSRAEAGTNCLRPFVLLSLSKSTWFQVGLGSHDPYLHLSAIQGKQTTVGFHSLIGQHHDESVDLHNTEPNKQYFSQVDQIPWQLESSQLNKRIV